MTFAAPAAPCSRLLPELGKELGMALEAGASTRDDVVYIHVNHASSAELMKRIAMTLDAEWVPMSGGFRLVRSVDVLKRQQKKEAQIQLQHIEKSLVQYKARAQPDVAFTPEKASSIASEFLRLSKGDAKVNRPLQRKLRMQMPSLIGLQRLVLAFTPSQLAELSRESYVTFSSLPTKMQRPFTPAMQKIVDRMFAEQAVWTEAAVKKGVDAKTLGAGSLTDWSADDKNTTKVLLVVSSVEGGFMFHLMVGKRGGPILANQTAAIGFEEPKQHEKAVSEGPRLVFPSEWEWLREDRHTAPKELVQQFLKPEKYEPMAFFSVPILSQIAKVEESQMVAYIQDSMLSDFLYIDADLGDDESTEPRKPDDKPVMPRVGEFLHRMENVDADIVRENGWITICPAHPLLERSKRIDRSLLGEYLRARISNPRMSLEQQAYYVNRYPMRDVAAFDGISISLKSILENMVNIRNTSLFDSSSLWLEFYGSLGEGLQRQALNGGVSLSVLSEDSRRILFDICNIDRGLQEPRPHDRNLIAAGGDEDAIPLKGILGEPSEAIYDGIGAPGTLNIVESESFAVTDSTAPTEVMEARAVAQSCSHHEDPVLAKKELEKRKFVVGRLRHLHFYVRFNDIAELVDTLTDRIPGTGPAVPYSSLPEKFRKEVEEVLNNPDRGDEAIK